MSTIVIVLSSPLTDARGEIYAVHGDRRAAKPLAEATKKHPLLEHVGEAVAEGCAQAILDLSAISSVTTAEVTWLTSFVWGVLTQGAQPALVIPEREVASAVQHVKMDRAFPVFPDATSALAAGPL